MFRTRSVNPTVYEKYVREATPLQGRRHVPHHSDECGRTKRHRPGEVAVVNGHAVVHAGGDERARSLR